MEGVLPSGSMPRWLVAWACGSRSSTQTRWPHSARAAARLTAVVVLPTPPFWLMIAIRRMGRPLLRAMGRLARRGDYTGEGEGREPQDVTSDISQEPAGRPRCAP